MNPACVLFDLDGTLVDTGPDLAWALNAMLQRHGRAPLDYAAIRPVASHGTPGLLGLGFGLTPDAPEFASLRQEYLALYEQTGYARSLLFKGLAETLAWLESHGRPWGVVTNKPARFTGPLMAALSLDTRAACIVSGDSATAPKPDPAPMRMACELAGIAPQHCLYVGDAARDVEAAHAVAMPCAIAAWGYIGHDDQPDKWGAELSFATPLALLAYLRESCSK